MSKPPDSSPEAAAVRVGADTPMKDPSGATSLQPGEAALMESTPRKRTVLTIRLAGDRSASLLMPEGYVTSDLARVASVVVQRVVLETESTEGRKL